MSVIQRSSGTSRLNCRWPLESVGCHDTGLTFTRSWASIAGLSFSPGTHHEPPETVNPALLPAISQVVMDLAIAINATVLGLQPELLDLSSQPEIRLIPW